jgi:hypothetical protein
LVFSFGEARENLALVVKEGKSSYINNLGEVVEPFRDYNGQRE